MRARHAEEIRAGIMAARLGWGLFIVVAYSERALVRRAYDRTISRRERVR